MPSLAPAPISIDPTGIEYPEDQLRSDYPQLTVMDSKLLAFRIYDGLNLDELGILFDLDPADVEEMFNLALSALKS